MAFYRGESPSYRIVRDDGHVDEQTLDGYFKDYAGWGEAERQALTWVKGRVLDIGCGPGRHLIWLQKKGCAVTGIDVSPPAIEVARLRGAKDCRLMDVKSLDFPAGSFDTVLMMGNNFGVAGGTEETKKVLTDLHRITAEDGIIIASSRDPLNTDNPRHLAYHEKNRRTGRPPGLVTIRLEFKAETSPWFELLLATPSEMEELAQQTRWKVLRVYEGVDAEKGQYYAILGKA